MWRRIGQQVLLVSRLPRAQLLQTDVFRRVHDLRGGSGGLRDRRRLLGIGHVGAGAGSSDRRRRTNRGVAVSGEGRFLLGHRGGSDGGGEKRSLRHHVRDHLDSRHHREAS